MDKFPLNQSGKINRKLLPEPKKNLDLEKEYIAPENEIEVKLVEIWKEMLGVDRVGITDNFFEIGGHSLKATFLMSRINKEFNIDIPLREIFSYPVIKDLAECIKNSAKRTWSRIEPIKNQEYYDVSSSQKRMYLINKMSDGGIEYNVAVAMDIEGKLDKEKMKNVFNEIVRRHESFRTSFDMIDGKLVQKIHEEVDFEMEYKIATKEEGDKIIKDFIRPFDLSKAPLLRVVLIKIEEEKHILLMDMHHIISDGVSIGILYKEIEELYKGVELKRSQIQYKEFAAWHNDYLKTEEIRRQEEYWLDVLKGELPILDIITDYPRPMHQTYQGDRIRFSADKEIVYGLKEICIQNNSTMYMVLLSAYNILLSKYSRQEDIIVGTPVAGRYHADIQNVVGMFVNTIAMRNKPKEDLKFSEFLKEVRINALKAYENQEYQFEELVEKVNTKRDLSRNPVFDVMFSVPNVDITEIDIEGLRFKEHELEYNIAKFDLTLSAIEQEKRISFELEYSTSLYKRSSIMRMAENYINILKQIVKNP
ncbi:condensation domain-containing protein, partial [Paramaledivibacter caminithermalis]